MNLKLSNLTVEESKEKLKENKYCVEACNILVKDTLNKSVSKSREFFEKLIGVFPLNYKYWKAYIEKELEAKNYDHVEQLFHRCLHIRHADLWKCYILYLKKTKKEMANYLTIMIEALELALKNVEFDMLSYTIWNEYLIHLKFLEEQNPSEADKYRDMRRECFQRGLQKPIINLEMLWKSYCQFEKDCNNESVLSEWETVYKKVAAVSIELENMMHHLNRHLPAVPPGQMTSVEDELKHLNLWKSYLYWEKQNPLGIDDSIEFMRRMSFAYDQSLLCFAYHSDIWYQAGSYFYQLSVEYDKKKQLTSDEKECAKLDRSKNYALKLATDIYERATNTFMRNNALIHLAYADLEERRKDYTKANEIYEKCLRNEEIEPTLIWIHFIRFVKRTEDISAARKIFKRAREDPRVTYQLIIANANLEYFFTKDKTVAFKIYAIVGKKYSHEAEYMLSYLNFMNHLNEDNNTRVLFERILSSEELPLQKSNEIWSEFLKFECAVGDLASILKVDKKRQKIFESAKANNVPGIENINQNTLIVDRYKYLDLFPSTNDELKSMGYKDFGHKLTSSTVKSNGIKRTNDEDDNDEMPTSGLMNTASSVATGEDDEEDQRMMVAHHLPKTVPELTKLLQENSHIAQSDYVVAAISDSKKSKFPIPDIMQMIPFKPARCTLPIQSFSGGVFQFPLSVIELLKHLPPPSTFEGPFVMIDELIKNFQDCELNEYFNPLYVNLNGQQMREFEYMRDYNSGTDFYHQKGFHHHKRNLNHSPTSDDEENKKSRISGGDFYSKQRHFKRYAKNANN